MSEPTLELSVDSTEWEAIPDVAGMAERAVLAALAAAGMPRDVATVSLMLTEDGEMRRLNRTFRERDRATNVLSWPAMTLSAPLREKDLRETGLRAAELPEPPVFLGDVALGYQTVRSEAHEHAKTIEQHASHLIVHGVLHLLGYDHQIDEDAAFMEEREIDALARLGWPDPYEIEAEPARR